MIDRRQFIATLSAISARLKRPFVASIPVFGAASTGGRTLRSQSLEIELLATGAIARIANHLSGETYTVSQDSFVITTSRGVFTNRDLTPETVENEEGIVSYRFRNPDQYIVSLRYRLAKNGESIERWLEIEDLRVPLDLLKIELGWTFPNRPPKETIVYDTFWNTPTTVFLRWPRGGLFTGIENPFFRTEAKTASISLTYEPSLILKPGDTYDSDPHYLGVYARSGRMIADHYLPTVAMRPLPRFRNPCGHIPLDWNEIQAMRRFALAYLAPRLDRFMCALYMYWYPIEQLWKATDEAHPEDAKLEAQYKRVVENVSELGGDLIIFNPLFPYKRPAADSSGYWNVAPENSSAGRIVALTHEKGIDCGFYMGVAAHGKEGNAAALPFAEEKQGWKKVDVAGGMNGENCIACREYADWWYAVQRNTISRFNLKFWSWDPGPGNGSFCYSRDHGHIPGKGNYKGWREATRLTGRLKDEFPQLKLMAFYGRKEYGLWGLKNFDMHESYWEQTIRYRSGTKHPDLHDDRINADGSRYQGWWNENFRFLPTAMNHALVHRLGENSYDSRLTKAWDMLGWRYALMSAIASSGAAVPCILPEHLSNVPEFTAFYKKWLGWARQNFEYIHYNVSLGEQVRPGGVEIYSRIRRDHGFIFLCNPAPRPARVEFALDAAMGLQMDGSFTLRQLYPASGPLYFDTLHQRGIFATKDKVSIDVPAYEVCLFELERFSTARLPLVFGAAGRVENGPGKIAIEEMSVQPGERADLRVLTKRGEEALVITLNGKPVSWTAAGRYQRAAVQFEGKALPRALDNWRLPDGKPFVFPYHKAADTLDLETEVFFDASIQALLARATPSNLAEYQDLLQKWRETLPHTYAWARPDRLWFALPFTDADNVKEASLRLNDRPVALEWFVPRDRPNGSRVIAYADLTDFIAFGSMNRLSLQLRGLGANQFLGPLLDYPLEVPVTAWSPASGNENKGVVYTRPIDPDMPVRVASAANPAPRVLAVEVDPPFLTASAIHTFSAEVDLPPERLANVWISVSASEDSAMTWNADRKKWIFEWKTQERAMDILDVDRAVVWAVAKEGATSSAFSIPLRWLFAKPSREKIEQALKSPWPNVREDARDLLNSRS